MRRTLLEIFRTITKKNMKHLILLSFFPLILFGQYTNIPDQNFELALLNLGYDFVIDGVVETWSKDYILF